LRNIVKNIAFFLFFMGCCLSISAQDSVTQKRKPQQPTRSNTAINNQRTTTSRNKIPAKRLTAADSLRLAAQRDSIQNATAAAGSAFDIGLPVTPETAKTAVTPNVPQLESSDNPFDIVSGGNASQRVDTTAKDSGQVKTATPSKTAQPSLLEPSIYTNNFLFWIFLVSLILMALVVANARAFISNAYSAVMSDSALRQIYKEPVGWGSAPYLSLYALYWLGLSIFIYLLLPHFGVSLPYGKMTTFLLCLAGVSGIYVLKHLVLYLIALIFPVSKQVRTYNFIILTVGVILGLLLMPLNIFIAYAPESLSTIFIYITFGVIGLAYLVRSLRGLMVASPFLVDNKFHFLLYLCTVEFAPLLIIIKLVWSKI
jgi:Domain of unknown function (DUF4271)